MSDLGIIGIGVMGLNLSQNFTSHGYQISAYDINSKQLQQLDDTTAVFTDLPNFVESLSIPRKILMMVTAGPAIDTIISQLQPLLEPGDILIDGGNSHFLHTRQRNAQLGLDQIRYVGLGISGGAMGARNGPSMMFGGDPEAWDQLQPLLESVAAKNQDQKPCVAWLGSDGAGHLVKTVHNGIEYADMQILSEAYHLMTSILKLDNQEIGDQFSAWNHGRLGSYLTEITAKIFTTKDRNEDLIDLILDKAGQKGTGRWSVEIALELGQCLSIITSAVEQRIISSKKDFRTEFSNLMALPSSDFPLSKDDIEAAVYLSRLLAHEQGFGLIATAADQYGWPSDLAVIANIWSAGCIIRSKLVRKLEKVFESSSHKSNFLEDPSMLSVIRETWPHLQRVIQAAVMCNVPIPSLMASYNYLASLLTNRLPANLIQAQRDFFGSHGFERIDTNGLKHHWQWL